MIRALALALFLLPTIAWATSLTYDERGNPFEAFGTFNDYVLQVNGTSNLINTLDGNTKAIEIICTVACHVAQAATPATATTNDFLVPANTYKIFGVRPNLKGFAVIANSSSGLAYVRELK